MELDLSGVLLIFLFGLRHGMAADHIAVIDGLGIHLHHQGKNWIIPWLGTLFAAGHGVIITIYIAFANFGINHLHPDSFGWLSWVPIILLFAISFLNLRALIRKPSNRHTHQFLVTSKHSKKGSIFGVLISVCMIMVFDTLADAAAWGFSAVSSRGFSSALIVGLVFTLGMIITDTIDSRLLASTIEKDPTNPKIVKQRRKLSWAIVIFSIAIGLQKVFSEFSPSFELSEEVDLMIGLLLVLVISISYIKIYRITMLE